MEAGYNGIVDLQGPLQAHDLSRFTVAFAPKGSGFLSGLSADGAAQAYCCWVGGLPAGPPAVH